MPITGGFGFMLDIKTGLRRRWYICRKTGIKRWADNDQPCNVKLTGDGRLLTRV